MIFILLILLILSIIFFINFDKNNYSNIIFGGKNKKNKKNKKKKKKKKKKKNSNKLAFNNDYSTLVINLESEVIKSEELIKKCEESSLNIPLIDDKVMVESVLIETKNKLKISKELLLAITAAIAAGVYYISTGDYFLTTNTDLTTNMDLATNAVALKSTTTDLVTSITPKMLSIYDAANIIKKNTINIVDSVLGVGVLGVGVLGIRKILFPTAHNNPATPNNNITTPTPPHNDNTTIDSYNIILEKIKEKPEEKTEENPEEKRCISICGIIYNKGVGSPDLEKIIKVNKNNKNNILYIYNENWENFQNKAYLERGGNNALLRPYRKDNHMSDSSANSLGIPTCYGFKQEWKDLVDSACFQIKTFIDRNLDINTIYYSADSNMMLGMDLATSFQSGSDYSNIVQPIKNKFGFI